MRANFTLFYFLISIILIFPQKKSNSDEVQSENSLLWKIEGKRMLKPSYIFGVVKYICEDDFGMRTEIINSFNQAQQLCLEVETQDTIAITQSHNSMFNYMFSDSLRFSTTLTQDKYQAIENLLYAKTGEHLKDYDYLKPFFIYEIYFNKVVTCTPKSFEKELITLAEQSKKGIVGISTPIEQVKFKGSSIHYDELASILAQTTEERMNRASNVLYEYYLDENLYGIKKLMQSLITTKSDDYKKLMLERNKLWAKRVPEIMKNKTTFFAIGAENLIGSEGLLQALINEGYKVTAIKPKKDQ